MTKAEIIADLIQHGMAPDKAELAAPHVAQVIKEIVTIRTAKTIIPEIADKLVVLIEHCENRLEIIPTHQYALRTKREARRCLEMMYEASQTTGEDRDIKIVEAFHETEAVIEGLGAQFTELPQEGK
jgi:hypothetical protein